jgi:hypothetical protein
VPEFTDGSEGTFLMFAVKNGSDRQRWSILANENGGMKITGYNGKNFGPKDGKLANLNRVVLQNDVKPTNTWILQGL